MPLRSLRICLRGIYYIVCILRKYCLSHLDNHILRTVKGKPGGQRIVDHIEILVIAGVIRNLTRNLEGDRIADSCAVCIRTCRCQYFLFQRRLVILYLSRDITDNRQHIAG